MNNDVQSVGGGRAEARNAFRVVMSSKPWGSNRKYRRRRAVWALPRSSSQLVGSDGLNVSIAQRRGGGDTRRNPLVVSRLLKYRGGVYGAFAAADTSYVIVRASFLRIHH